MTESSTNVIEISGEAGIRQAVEIADRLRAALAKHDAVVVVLEAVTGIDITILQLLVSARKTALASGKSICLRAAAGGALRQALIKTGFVGPDGMPRTAEGDFWTRTSDQPRNEAA